MIKRQCFSAGHSRCEGLPPGKLCGAESLSARKIGDTDGRTQVLWCNPMEHLESQHGDLEDDVFQSMKPVWTIKHVCDVIRPTEIVAELSNCILYGMKTMDKVSWKTNQHLAATVQSRHYSYK